MSAPAPRRSLADFSEFVRTRMGLSFPEGKWDELERKVAMASTSLGFQDAASCIEWALSSPADKRQLEILASFLTIGETYFFREGKSLRALSEHVFPAIVLAHERIDRRVRIWSAGCCTGEEPYTLAMMVSDHEAFKGFEVSILGTDINQAFLDKAESGVYTEWSFRGVPAEIKERFFTKADGASLRIIPDIKSKVSFSCLNLVDDVYPALINDTNAIDLILCRNVLMYFTADYTRSIIQKFRRSLLPEGWLLVSPVEAPFVDQSDFSPFLHTGAILHRKVGYKAQACAAPLKLPASRPVNRALPPVEILKPVGDWKRAESIYAQADYASAIKELLALVSRPKAGLEAIMLLSRSYANAGLLGEAERWADEAASVDPMSAGARYLVALIRIEVRRADEAMADLRKAIYLEPDFIMAQYTLSGLYRKKRKFADADRLLRNVTAALRGRGPDEVLPESEGLTVGMLTDLIVAARAEIKTVVHA